MATMVKKCISCADTAKLLRSALKAQFPNDKFSVRSDTYAGGASIRVRWVDGSYVADVEKIAKRYEGATFDGMQDLKEYQSDLVYFEGESVPTLVRYGSDFVFTDRDLSPAYVEQLSIEAQKLLDEHSETAGQVFALNERMLHGVGLATSFGVIDHPYALGWNIVRFLSHHIPPKGA